MDLGYWRKQIRHTRSLWIVFTSVAGIGLALIFIAQLNSRIRPILLELALSQTSNQITAVIDQAVSEQAVAYSDLITLERSDT